MKRQHVAVVALVAMFALAGCADMTVTTTVDSDGEIEQFQMETEMDQQGYALALEEAEEQGYDSVSEAMATDFEAETDGAVSDAETNEYRDGETFVAEVTYNEVNMDQVTSVDTTITDDDTLIYTEESPDSVDDEVDITYRVNMPGEIVKTNADRVDEENNIAIWELDGDTETLYVESERDHFSLWTVAAVVGVGALALIGGFVVYRRIGEGYVETNDTP